jgi:hypothetical protein
MQSSQMIPHFAHTTNILGSPFKACSNPMHSLYGISLQIREVKGFKFKFIFTYKKGIKIDKKFSQSETGPM